MPDNDNSDRRGKINSIFTEAVRKAKLKRPKADPAEILLPVDPETDGITVRWSIDALNHLDLKYSVDDAGNVKLEQTEKPLGIGNLEDNGIDDVIANIITNEILRNVLCPKLNRK